MNIDLIKERNLVIPTYMILIAKKFELNLEDFLLISYFWNYKDSLFDVKEIESVLKLRENVVLTSFNTLLTKNLISIKTFKDNNGKIVEVIDLDNTYKEIDLIYNEKKKEEEKSDIYSTFEQEFGRTISSMEYEIIYAWLEKGFSEELILGALKEAVFNGVNNLKYIDRILFEWNKKGYKNLSDVEKDKKNERISKSKEEKVLFDYNWLDDNEK